MRTQKILSALLFSTALVCFSTAAHAGSCPSSSTATPPTADFAGNCTRVNDNFYCAFDALRDTAEADPSVCPGSSISAVFWDFGDGDSVWDDTYTSHAYLDPAEDFALVTATVFCANGCSDDHSRDLAFVVVGWPGLINYGNGWN